MLWLVLGFGLAGPSLAMTWTLSRVKDKKGRKRKRIRKEESGVRKKRKESQEAFLTPHSSSAKAMTLYMNIVESLMLVRVLRSQRKHQEDLLDPILHSQNE